MSQLSKESKKTILELLNRYEISIKAKENHPDLTEQEISEVRYFCYMSIFAFISFIGFYFGGEGKGFSLPPLLTFIGLLFLFLAIISFIFFVLDTKWEGVIEYYKKYLSISKLVYKIKRYWKSKNSKNFEDSLKNNYLEIRDWFKSCNNYENLTKLVDEMRFPSTSSYRTVDTKEIKDFLKRKPRRDIVLNKKFIGIDELESSVSENKETGEVEEVVRFFEKSG